jgi:cytoplasmic iron level regulating protein YaaA (DUF328/UPF0246 family)
MKFCLENKRFPTKFTTMKILLSPAKLMRSYPPIATSPLPFTKETKSLIQILKKWTVADFAVQMKLSEEKAKETYVMFQKWGEKANQSNVSPAIFAYIGEAFKALNAAQLSEGELAYLQKNLWILSGLYGVLSAAENIEPYRLEMAQRGVAPKGQSLYAYWRPHIEKHLLNILDSDEQILNLASSEYSDLLQDERLRTRFITPHFLESKNGQLKAVSVFAKQARGTMARWCATQQINEPLAIKGFDDLGYRYSSANSSENELVFIR